MKAQVAFEYMMIFGLALAFAIPVWIYVASVQQGTGEELSASYAENAARQMTSSADLVYSQGSPAKVRLNVYIPSGVDNASITGGRTIVFTVRTSAGPTDIFSSSVANMTGTIPSSEGSYLINIESRGSYVEITPE